MSIKRRAGDGHFTWDGFGFRLMKPTDDGTGPSSSPTRCKAHPATVGSRRKMAHQPSTAWAEVNQFTDRGPSRGPLRRHLTPRRSDGNHRFCQRSWVANCATGLGVGWESDGTIDRHRLRFTGSRAERPVDRAGMKATGRERRLSGLRRLAHGRRRRRATATSRLRRLRERWRGDRQLPLLCDAHRHGEFTPARPGVHTQGTASIGSRAMPR